jgi:hypothetical protein
VSRGSIFEPQPRSTEDRVEYGNNCDATQSHSTNSSTDSVLRLYLPKIEETMKQVSVRLFLLPFRGLVDKAEMGSRFAAHYFGRETLGCCSKQSRRLPCNMMTVPLLRSSRRS